MNINEIKEAVERAKINPLLTANAPEWLQYLIGELEWKDQIIASLQDNYNRALMQDNLSIKVIEELRKTLEWYADEKNHRWTVDFCDHLILSNAMKDEGEIARQALKEGSHD